MYRTNKRLGTRKPTTTTPTVIEFTEPSTVEPTSKLYTENSGL